MLYTIIKENTYQDSIVLMLLSNKLSAMDGVNKVSIMMGTPANKDIFRASGFDSPELDEAKPNDIVIMIDTDDESMVDEVNQQVEDELKGKAEDDKAESTQEVSNWNQALDKATNPNLALISVPGQYAAMEAETALRNNLHVFMFSDNVPKDDEVRLKEMAHDKGLLVMGPDCGTGIIHSLPLAFTNIVNKGDIGIVGASGTGIQEVTTIVDREGKGVTNAIGTGGHDLSTEVGAITMMDSIKALAQDPAVKVITVVSKPPAKEVEEKVLNLLRNIDKPVVTLFLGHKPEYTEANIYHAYTLEEAARVSVQLSNGEKPEFKPATKEIKATLKDGQDGIKGYYSGGTLASEAAMLVKDAFDGLKDETTEGFTYKAGNHEIIDLGDDMYTQGRPHPMIDPGKRIEKLQEAANDENTAVIMLDNVIGYGSHDDMAGQLAPAIEDIISEAKANGRDIAVLATVVGTEHDPQNYEQQIKTLEEAGAQICETNDQMVRSAIELTGHKAEQPELKEESFDATSVDLSVDDKILQLINTTPSVINVGLKSFATAIDESGADVVQFNWRPVAGGDEKLMKVLQFLNNYEGESV